MLNLKIQIPFEKKNSPKKLISRYNMQPCVPSPYCDPRTDKSKRGTISTFQTFSICSFSLSTRYPTILKLLSMSTGISS